MNILQALDDPKVFGAHFRAGTWDAWRVFLKALFALPMSEDDLALYRKHTGRNAPPRAASHEAWLVCGRRAGKSFTLALIAVFLACFKDWRAFLGPGEIGTIMVVCSDRRQARVIMRYVLGLLKAVPMLKRQVENVTRESIALKNRVVVEVHTASFRSTRGYTIVAALLDELAFWGDENSAEPDIEVINAIKPAMATIPDAMLLCASSPYGRRGALWNAYHAHFGKDGDPVLVWQAATRDMNATVPQSYIDKHLADDPARAAAEYGAVFRTDIQTFIGREVIEAAVVPGRQELPPVSNVSYVGFVDPSGGSADSFTLAIAHRDKDQRGVLDVLREVRPPFSPDDVAREFAVLLKRYCVHTVVGDRYGGEWPRERFQIHGINYDVSERPKSDIYRDFLPALNSGQTELLDHSRLVTQLCGLERRTARSGRDSIDHAPGGHDDLCNAAAGALLATQAAAPALWRQEALLVGGAAVELPARCDVLFAVLVAGQNGTIAVAFFAFNKFLPGVALTLVDVDLVPLAADFFDALTRRLVSLSKFCRPRTGIVQLYASAPLADEAQRRGLPCEPIDGLMSASEIASIRMSAAVHIGAGKVKIAAEVLARAEHLALGGILNAAMHGDDDPLTMAALCGVALALDANRTLKAA